MMKFKRLHWGIEKGNMMKKIVLSVIALSMLMLGSPAFAGTHGTNGHEYVWM